MAIGRRGGRALALVAALVLAAPLGGVAPVRAASEIKIIVNNQAITSVDLARRTAFLRLQRAKGNLAQKAREQLTEEALKMQEARRVGLSIPDAQVEASYQRFAQSNKMTAGQLNKVLAQAGVTAGHFKDYIRVQMTWPRLVRARFASADGGQMSTQELVSKMLERGGSKPSTTEYILQQVIFVVPKAKRSNALLAARKREAEQLRGRLSGCGGTHDVVKGLRDVTVRDLGRVLQPQLPADWKPLIEKSNAGSTTGTRTTDRGIEFILICSEKTVSDDVAAAMVFQAEGDDGDGDSADAQKFLEELRGRARISNR
ncbi:SurA N-terminal domain-containing protein [Pseudohoeflea sp. DP4N28-3]|uniref:SurA N-terminal domain-containing protein n=2 Tax=Pseudohoeflea coraliihabitans TaxID=2860393 RepID=A0ABS6WS06_9HYPH|nr:peptidylprolyl isomerase [Pseudohoeflea sp. DP4N28-3]MBW3098711.1 SurA N-terminal domain-containing protein [Pseudohoeflea sp. DP4N28-3]